MEILIPAIQSASFILTLAVLADIILSFFMSPYHPIRNFLDSLVQPLLRPIRRVLPTFGGFDFSPMILIIVIQLAESFLISLVRSLG